MLRIAPMERLPVNFEAFVDEISAGIGGLYGPSAAADYRRTARHVVSANLTHASVMAIGAYEGESMAGLLMAVVREASAEISIIHVLETHAGRGIEGRLLRKAVQTLRGGGVDGIVCEFVPFCRLTASEEFAELGFERIGRVLMTAPVDSPELLSDAEDPATPCRRDQWPEAADCIVDGYRGHPGRALHAEVRDHGRALDYITRLSLGNFGPFREDYLRAVWDGELCLGAILGVEVAAETGFVLQLAVRRSHQGSGIGTALLRSLAGSFRARRFGMMALGVTRSNPALQLYERLGFKTLRAVDAYVWRAGDAAP